MKELKRYWAHVGGQVGVVDQQYNVAGMSMVYLSFDIEAAIAEAKREGEREVVEAVKAWARSTDEQQAGSGEGLP